jgi:hypothetical protein
MHFVLSSNQYGAAASTMTRIYTGRYAVQILAAASEPSLLQNIQTSSSAQPAHKSMKTKFFSVALKWPWQTVSPFTSV